MRDVNQIVLASRNAAKARELEELLGPLGFRVRRVSEFSPIEPAETAATFVENALIKARHAAAVSGLPAIADDSGLCVDALDGAPGVRSARYAGEPASDAVNNAKLLAEMDHVPEPGRGAEFVCALVMLRRPADPIPLIAEGRWRGSILAAPRGGNGFGYDPLFYVPSHHCTAAQLAPDVKNRISHRGLAMAKLFAQLQ
ncbi:MAG: RdgB/HAM1 family non-canonical purine NTP pyrophosphatase [Panacagrimonas sp.]